MIEYSCKEKKKTEDNYENDSFLDEMEKACYLIGEKLNTSREEAIEILKRKKK